MRIPRHSSSREITGASPSVEMPTQDPVGQAITQAGQALQSIGSNLIEAKVFQETTQAELDYSSGLNVILAEAKQDTDIDNPETLAKYNSRISDLRSKVSRGLRVPKSKNQFGIYSEKHAISAKAELAKTATKMVVDKGIAGTLETLESWKNQYATAGDAETREMLIGQGENKIDEAVRQGFWTHEKGFREKQKMKKAWQDAAVNVLISIEPEEAERQIVEGEIPELSAEDKSSYLKIIDTAKAAKERREIRELKARQSQNSVDLGIGLLRGEKTIVDVIELTNSQEITPKTAQVAFDYLWIDSGQEHMKTDEASWNYVMDVMTDPKATMEKFYGTIFDAKLSGTDAEMFLGWAKDGYDYIADYKPMEPKWEYYGKVRETMKDFVKKAYNPGQQPKALYDMSRTLFDLIMAGEVEPDKIREKGQELIGQEVLKVVPSAANAPKSGAVYVDAYGNLAKITPDGKVEPIE